jgi:ubiquinone/menaquinone biosynthesis C-methylase UbiE
MAGIKREHLFGYERERLGTLSFQIMGCFLALRDVFMSIDKRVEFFGIKEGHRVVDYGCGIGSYIKKASELVGPSGTVYAVDVHELAIKAVEEKKNKYGLKNVISILANNYPINIESRSIDIIYAMDMFHMVKDTNKFLSELNRIISPDGLLFIEGGHQPRLIARRKIEDSSYWDIIIETKGIFRCGPVIKNI